MQYLLNRIKTFIYEYGRLVCNRYISITPLALFLVIRIFFHRIPSPCWDSSVYILMGKYIYSSGSIGLWEPFRPIFLPIALGFFWKIGFDPIFCGLLIEILFSLGSIYLVYLIGNRVFGRRAGILAAFLFSLSPTYFFWSKSILTRLPSTFFSLLSVYIFLSSRYLCAGILTGIASITNFTQILLAPCLFSARLIKNFSRDSLLAGLRFLLGFFIIAIAFFAINIIMYMNPIYPLLITSKVLGGYSLYWHVGPLYYVKYLILNESLSLLLYLVSIYFIYKEKVRFEKLTILLTCSVFLVFVNIIYTQQDRYLIVVLPYLCLLSSYSLTKIYDFTKKNIKYSRVVLYIILVIFSLNKYNQLKNTDDIAAVGKDIFQKYVEQNEYRMKGSIWISNPMALVYSDLKASQLMYYPIFDISKVEELESNINTADWILFNSDDLPITPFNDKACEDKKNRLIARIISDFELQIYGVDNSGKIKAGIFKNKR